MNYEIDFNEIKKDARNNKLKKILIAVCIVAVLLLLFIFFKPNKADSILSSVTILNTDPMAEGEVRELIVQYSTEDGSILPPDELEAAIDALDPHWISSDKDVATVKDGIVTAIASGDAVITLYAGKLEASVNIMVTNPVVDFTISDIKLEYGDKPKTPVFVVSPSGARARSMSMEIEDPSIVEIVENQLVAKQVGETRLAMTVDNITKVVNVTVVDEKENTIPIGIGSGNSETDPSASPSPSTSPSPSSSPKPTGNGNLAGNTGNVQKCGSVGHTMAGTCPVCGNVYAATTPTTKPTEAPVPTSTPKPTEAPKCGEIGHTKVGLCPVCGSLKTLPQCGAVGHTVEGTCPVCGGFYKKPVCGAVGHTADGTCIVCGSTYFTPRCPDCGSVFHTVHPTATPTPTPTPEPTDSPVTPTPTPTPAAKCPTCGSSFHTVHPVDPTSTPKPTATPTPTPTPQATPKPTCPICGSTAHTKHPAGGGTSAGMDGMESGGDWHYTIGPNGDDDFIWYG